MNILITGGAGYIGSHCNKYLNNNGFNTVIVDNLSFGHKEAVKEGIFIQGDFGDKEFIKEIMNNYQIDAVMHFAAFANVSESVQNPSKYYCNNVLKIINLLDCMVECGIKYIVFSSSAATFGKPKYIPIDESHSQIPINPYGQTKLMGEKILSDYENAYGIKYSILRYFNASGADLEGEIGESHNPEHHLIPVIFQVFNNKREKLDIYGSDYPTSDGTCIRDFVHVSDLSEAHYLALNYLISSSKSEDFNLGSNQGYSIKEVLKKCEEIIGTTIDFELCGARPGDPSILVASNNKAKDILAWKPKYSDLDTIIKSAWIWENNRKF